MLFDEFISSSSGFLALVFGINLRIVTVQFFIFLVRPPSNPVSRNMVGRVLQALQYSVMLIQGFMKKRTETLNKKATFKYALVVRRIFRKKPNYDTIKALTLVANFY